MGGSLQLHQQLTERLIKSLGLLEYDSRVFGQSLVRIVPGGNFLGKATNMDTRGFRNSCINLRAIWFANFNMPKRRWCS
jgi:hypothetical protein